MYHQFSTFCPHSVFMCFVWISEQTAIISLYSINWLVCITETECVYCAVRTGYLYIIQIPLKPSGHYMYRTVVTICTASLTLNNSTFYPHTVFMCFVWISEQTAIISLYNINWLVCITETECVYCAVRTGYLYIIQILLKPSSHYMYRTVVTICTTSLTFNNSTFCPHCVFLCFVWMSEQTAIISLYNISWLVCIFRKLCVYCAVRTGYLNHIEFRR